MPSRQVSDIVFRDDLYPRIETSAVTVQKYAEDLSVLPPIEVNQHNELIDGWHRWTAHKKADAKEISVKVTKTASDAEFLELAIERNASHGLQLSQSDKRDMARKIYASTADKERDDKKKQLAKILSVSERTVADWLSRMDKDAKEARNKRIFEMWLACYSMEEIGEAAYAVLYTLSDIANPANDRWKDIVRFRVMRLWPQPEAKWTLYTPEEWASQLVKLREWSSAKVDRCASGMLTQ